MAEKKFHLFVRKHAGVGCAASVLTHPHLAAFATDPLNARADVAKVAERLLTRRGSNLWNEVTFWPDLRVRRMDLTVRAVQHDRLLPVPMRFSVITHGPLGEGETLGFGSLGSGLTTAGVAAAAGGRARKEKRKGPMTVLIPRLDLAGSLADPDDLEPFVEELVRHALYLAPLERLLRVAYVGEESVETLIVSARPRVIPEKKRAADELKKEKKPLPPALAEAARRLDDEAAVGLLDRAFQRDREVGLLVETVTSRKRSSALLVGGPSVGKTTIVHELVHRIRDAAPGTPLHGVEVYSTSGGRITAGMRYLGQWQERVQRMLDELRVRRAVLHVESLAELLSTGKSDEGLDVARHLLPAIETGEVVLIIEATPEDVARAERTHAAFLQAMRAQIVAPLEIAAARLALMSAALRIARARKVRFTDDAYLRAIDLTERFGDGAGLPGGAVQLLRAAAHREDSLLETASSAEPPADGAAPDRTRTVSAADVTTAFTVRTGYPREIVDPSVPLDPDAVLRFLRERVIGQDDAMVLLRNLVVTLKTGLSDPARPLGAFLFLGPTGVGKTESALTLAGYLFGDDKRLARFDMSEFAAPGSAARLVSDMGGQEGTLARRVREQPFGIVLLDEIEKADSGVHDLLLQILGEGRLTDATGRTVSFRNTVVILTSNLGAESAGQSLGFGDGTARGREAHYLGAAAAFFRPELLNRFDQVVPFQPLAPETVAAIARRALVAALEREGLTRRGVKVDYSDDVVARLAALGFDPRYGARPLKRAIEHQVVGPIAQLLAARTATPPKGLTLSVRGDGIAIDVRE